MHIWSILSAVLLFDMFKAFAAVWLCRALFPEMELASVIAGSMAVIGHIFPFYLHFKGGKGIASLTGFILAADWKCFLFLLIVGCIAAVIVNYGCAISFSAASLFPVICLVKLQSVAAFAILTRYYSTFSNFVYWISDTSDGTG